MYGYNEDNEVKLDAVNTLAGLAPKLTIASENGELNVRFNGNLLKQNKIHYNHGRVINIYATHKLKKRTIIITDFVAQNTLFGAVKLTKDSEEDHYGYSGYGICFDSRDSYSIGNISNGKNVINFGCDMSFSSHPTNQVNDIYVLEKGVVRGIGKKAGSEITVYAEKLSTINFTQFDKRFVLPLHYNSSGDSYLFINSVKQLTFKSKVSRADKNLFTLGNISSDWSVTNMKKNRITWKYFYDCSIDYWPIHTGKTRDIRRYLMKKKSSCIKMFNLIKND